MKKNVFVLLSILSFSIAITKAQDSDKKSDFGIKFGGFVKTDIFYDTRQSSASNGIRDGHFYLFPDNVLYDADSNDINAKGKLRMLSIQTRLRGAITGPDAFGAKTSGVIEAEFFGTSDADMNGFRLRHGFVKLDWAKTSLLVGQTWHPMFPAESFPGTISFNTGVPFVPFSRNPQLRLTHKFGPVKMLLTAYTQRDFSSTGPDGTNSKYLSNSGLPGSDLQIQFTPGSSENFFALGVDYKTLMPEIVTSNNYITDNTIGSFSAYCVAKLKLKPITVKLMGTYAQNGTDLMLIGGYAIKDTTDKIKGYKEYTNINSASAWIDIQTNREKINAGLFAGYSKNLGSSDEIHGKTFSRGANIDNLMRISPRVTFTSGKVTFCTEVELTTAAYGKIEAKGTVTDTETVQNIRFLFAAIYKF